MTGLGPKWAGSEEPRPAPVDDRVQTRTRLAGPKHLMPLNIAPSDPLPSILSTWKKARLIQSNLLKNRIS